MRFYNLTQAMGHLGFDDLPLINRVFDIFDADDSSSIDYREMVCGVDLLLRGHGEETLRFCFSIYDLDDSGYRPAGSGCLVGSSKRTPFTLAGEWRVGITSKCAYTRGTARNRPTKYRTPDCNAYGKPERDEAARRACRRKN